MSELEVDEAPPELAEADGSVARKLAEVQSFKSSTDAGMRAERGMTQRNKVPPVAATLQHSSTNILGARVGTLVGLTDDGRTPLVIFRGQLGTAAVAGRATLDLHAAHLGRSVVLMFEDGDLSQPIIVGCIAQQGNQALEAQAGQFEVDADGERLLVTAGEQLVLRCGKASITLTKAGKVLIQGTYISTRSSGVYRIKGGSVQLN